MTYEQYPIGMPGSSCMLTPLTGGTTGYGDRVSG